VSCRSLFGDFKILTVTALYIYIYEILCIIKKNKIYTTQYSNIYKHNTKGKQDLYVQLCSTACCKKSVINMGIKIHNKLPFELKRMENFKIFRNQLKVIYYKTVFILYKTF
jgi:hypothetical protein